MAKSNEKKGLGTGLGALFGDADIFEQENELQYVQLEKIEPRDSQPRKYFKEEALQELADSIKEYGLIQPVTVRKLDSGYYQIIAGERRWRASKLAGLNEIPVRILDADDLKTAQLALIENLQREDLNPIEEAEGYRSLMENFDFTQEQAAKSVGRSRPAIANSLRLLSLCEGVKELVSDGKLSAGHARTLVPIENEDLQLNTAKTIAEKSLSVRQAERLVSSIISKKAPEEKSSEIAVDYAETVSARLSETLGRKVKLTDGKKTGRIELEFYGPDDRENLIALLMNLNK